MGAGVSLLHKRKTEVFNVMDDPKDPNYGVSFSANIFNPTEWNLLKTFCQKKGIYQTDLLHLFSIFCGDSDVYLRHFRVRIEDLKKHFLRLTRVCFELNDIFVPSLFLRAMNGLEEAYSHSEVSFVRFVILGYMFSSCPAPDLVYEYFAIMRQNYKLKITSTVYTYNLQENLLTLNEELQKSAAMTYCMKKCNPANNTEVDLRTIMCMSIKYPIMFYALERFRVHFRRAFFGDKFWKGRNASKSKFPELYTEHSSVFKGGFENEDVANMLSCRSILGDAQRDLYDNDMPLLVGTTKSEQQTKPGGQGELQNLSSDKLEVAQRPDSKSTGEFRLWVAKYAPELRPPLAKVKSLQLSGDIGKHPEEISSDVCKRLVHDVGYRLGRDIILESKLPYPENVNFMCVPENEDKEERTLDKETEEEFIINTATGGRDWVKKFTQPNTNLDDTYAYDENNMGTLRESWSAF